jgi:LemA protein
MKRLLVVLTLLAATLGLSGCGYNTIQSQDEQIKAAWSEVVNQYKRRSDLIPNLVAAVKGYAQQAQSEMSSALARLLVVSENYPQLKSDQNFRDLQAQLEGTENRITVARKRYIDAVQQYNTTIRQFPVNLTAMMFSYKEKPNFTVENEAAISQPPTVDFNKPAPAGGQPPAAPQPAQKQ